MLSVKRGGAGQGPALATLRAATKAALGVEPYIANMHPTPHDDPKVYPWVNLRDAPAPSYLVLDGGCGFIVVSFLYFLYLLRTHPPPPPGPMSRILVWFGGGGMPGRISW